MCSASAICFKLLRHWLNKGRNFKREEPLNPAWSDQGELAASSTSILDRLSREEDAERLNLVMNWCREEDRALIFLHLFEGQTHVEIADRLGIAPEAVRQRYCRAVRRVSDAWKLMELMTRSGLGDRQQDVIGVHRFQRADPDNLVWSLRYG